MLLNASISIRLQAIKSSIVFFSCFVLTEVKVIFCGEEAIFFSSSTSWFIKIKKSVAGQ